MAEKSLACRGGKVIGITVFLKMLSYGKLNLKPKFGHNYLYFYFMG